MGICMNYALFFTYQAIVTQGNFDLSCSFSSSVWLQTRILTLPASNRPERRTNSLALYLRRTWMVTFRGVAGMLNSSHWLTWQRKCSTGCTWAGRSGGCGIWWSLTRAAASNCGSGARTLCGVNSFSETLMFGGLVELGQPLAQHCGKIGQQMRPSEDTAPEFRHSHVLSLSSAAESSKGQICWPIMS